jgi:homoserine dehydrogenase
MRVNVALVGLGNVNRSLLQILAAKAGRIKQEFGLEFCIRLVADSRGVAYSKQDFGPNELLECKSRRGSSSDLRGFLGHTSVESLLASADIDLVFEASPVDLATGGPGLRIARAALTQGISVVLANKGPIVLAYKELHEIAARSGAGLKFSATVCGGLPVMNIAKRDFVAGSILRLRGVFNSTTNFILDEMNSGRAYEAALAEAQERGIAETDPSLDINGWDTANKLLIIARSLLGVDIDLRDISVTGIADITASRISAERSRGRVFKLVAHADGEEFSVAPIALPTDDFLAQCVGWEMAIEIHTDIYGVSYHKLWEREPIPTAASMLRDAIHIFAR